MARSSIAASILPPQRSARRMWVCTSAAFALLAAIILFTYRETFESISEIWLRSETYTHGLLIVPIVVFLIWRKRRDLASITPSPSMWGALVLVGSTLLWLAGTIGNVLLLRQGGALAMIPALVWALAGTQSARVLRFPLTYLAFALPMGAALVPALQDLTAEFVVRALRLIGVPVFVEGRFFSVPAGNFEVAAACSGVRYLIASLAIGTLYAYLVYRSPSRRLAFLAMTIIVPIVANGVRAFGIVMIASLSKMRYAVGVDHLIYGWIFFGFVMVLLFWLGERMREPAHTIEQVQHSPSSNRPRAGFLGLAAMAMACIAVVLVAPFAMSRTVVDREVSYIVELDRLESRWNGPVEQASRGWLPEFAGPTAQAFGTYRSDIGDSVDVYVAFYAEQSQGAELINAENRLFDTSLWQLVAERAATTAGAFEHALPSAVNEIDLRGARGQLLLWYWYQIGDTAVDGDLRAKWLEAVRQVKRLPARSGVIAIATRHNDDPARARVVLRDALAELLTTSVPGDATLDLNVARVVAHGGKGMVDGH